jgi:hypothetical protein
MKARILYPLVWAGLGSAAYLKRDPQGSTLPALDNINKVAQIMEQVAPNIKPVTVEAKPQLRPDAKRKILRFGPHTIPASKVSASSINSKAHN